MLAAKEWFSRLPFSKKAIGINAVFRLIGNVPQNGKMRIYRFLPIWGTLLKK